MGAGNLRFMRVVQFIFSARKISTDVPDGWEMFNFILSGGGIFASECFAGIVTRSCDLLGFVQRILRPCANFVKMSTHVMFFVTKILDNSYRHLAICVLVTLTISTGKNEKGSGYLPRWAVRVGGLSVSVAGQLPGFFSRSVVIDIG